MPFVKGYLEEVPPEPPKPQPQPPGIWGGANEPFPTPPIANVPGVPGYQPPGKPPGTWGGSGEPFPTPPIVIPPDAIEPGVPTHPIYIPVFPAHPIVIPPEAIAPGVPTHPIVLPPPVPGHPIVLPPDSIGPGVPSHPIALPGDPWWGQDKPPVSPPSENWDWAFSPVYGWVLVPPGGGGKPQPIP